MRTKSLLYFLPIFLMSLPAQAEETYPRKQIGWWSVYGWDKDCWMKAEFTDGTTLSYSWDASTNDSYMAIRNAKWVSIKNGQRYALRIEIDEWSTEEDGGGHTGGVDPGVSFFLNADAKELFLGRIAVGKSIRFFVGSKLVGNYSLKDSGQAARELAECSAALSLRAEPDPFQTV